jgi:hypothetical protein
MATVRTDWVSPFILRILGLSKLLMSEGIKKASRCREQPRPTRIPAPCMVIRLQVTCESTFIRIAVANPTVPSLISIASTFTIHQSYKSPDPSPYIPHNVKSNMPDMHLDRTQLAKAIPHSMLLIAHLLRLFTTESQVEGI